MPKRLSIMLLMLPGLLVSAQSLRLTPYRAPSALYLNLDHLYGYNRYEHSRIEAGLTWVTPNEAAEPRPASIGQWSLGGYAAYGFKDQGLKYGVAVQLRLPGQGDVKLRFRAFNDLETAASRRMGDYSFLSPELNTTFLASRYVGVKGIRFDVKVSPRRDWELSAGALLAWEQYRFNNDGPLYPRLTPDAMPMALPHAAFTARADWSRGLAVTATAGVTKGEYVDRNDVPYLRLLAQYDAEPGEFGLHVFGQAGFVSALAPYSRMFDLSGTAKSGYFFRNTFLTVRPNTFTANMFAHLCLNYTPPMPLWELSWSQPLAFLQVNAMWGQLFGQDIDGKLHHDGLDLQAPHLGLLEPAAGFDGLVHWGLIDLGFAVAYQICPFDAPYMNETLTDNFAFTFVATLIFEKTPRRVPVTPTQPYQIIPINQL